MAKAGSGACSKQALRALLQVEAGQDGSWVQMLSRDIENMRSLLLGQLRSIGSLEEDAQAWNRVWCEHPRAWERSCAKVCLGVFGL